MTYPHPPGTWPGNRRPNNQPAGVTMLPTTTLDGRLVADPELRFTASGKAVCSMRVAASDSTKDDAGNWTTNEQIFVNVSLWDGEAEAAANTLRQGMRVLVTGRLYQREYDANDGTKRTSLEFKFPTVAQVISGTKNAPSSPAQRPVAADPWATPAAAPSGSEPPF